MNTKDKVEQYFNELCVIDIDDPQIFWDNLENKYGQDICIMIDNAMSERSNGSASGRIYTVKNKTLDLSLDFATYSKDLYRRYLNKIIDLNLKPKKILDIACDNGIVACFYGILYPEAEVLGIDIGGNSIKCAKELAEKLELKNVKFEQVDIKKLNKVCKDEKFDFISSVRSLKEIFNLPYDMRVWNLKEADDFQVVKKQIFSISKLSEYLADDGLLITFERLASFEEQVYFNNLFNKAGLVLNKDMSFKIHFHELGNKQIMPLFVYKKGEATETSYDLIVNNFVHNEDTLNYEKFINIASNDSLITGIQVNYCDGSGKMRHELWKNEEGLVFIKYTNTGYRELKTYSYDKLDEIKNIIKEEKETMQMYGQNVYEYISIEERNKVR